MVTHKMTDIEHKVSTELVPRLARANVIFPLLSTLKYHLSQFGMIYELLQHMILSGETAADLATLNFWEDSYKIT